MRYLFLSCFMGFGFLTLIYAQELNVPVAKYMPEKWNCAWITHPDISLNDYNVVLFRKILELDKKPVQYIINITADNRYRLYVNGKQVCYGPQLSDIRHWRFETVDIARYLNVGKNSICVDVVNWGPDRFFGIISAKTGLLINGFTENERIINTEDKTWKVSVNKGYSPKHPNWMYGVDIVGGFYASNPGDSLNANYFPWDWKNIDYDDSQWKKAKWLAGPAAWGGSFNWILKPRTTPLQKDTIERFTKIVRAQNVVVDPLFLKGQKGITIPANSSASFLIDQTYLTLGFPEMKITGGKDAVFKITYAENLYNKDKTRRNRNDIEGQVVIGLYDKYVLDGGANRVFKPTWFKAFRFIQVEIQTKSEAVTINDYFNVYTGAPITKKASFKSDNPSYDKIMDICWRTARICTQDNLVSDAYYEQMQYVGDSRVHAMTNLYLTGESIWMRNAIEQFNYSRMPDGMITSCYPLRATFVHPTFTLIWIDMVYDYMMHVDDKSFVNNQLSNIQQSLYWFENHVNENGLLGKSEWPYFVDWYRKVKGEGNGGTAKVSKEGNSAVITLHYIYSLQNASRIFAYCGKTYEANQFAEKAKKLQENVNKSCFDEKSGTYFEDPAKTFKCQRPNLMAVMTNTIPVEKQKALLEKIIPDTSMDQAGLYYRFNMFNAMTKAKAGNMFNEALKPWYKLLDNGLTTTTEVPLDPNLGQRSDAHPWSTSPAMAFFSVVCGIQSAEIGFKSVKIEPQMGDLSFIKSTFPHYKGEISMDLKKTGASGISGKITLPEGLKGTFVWNNKETILNSGANSINQ
ncbi:MAG: family 78 glycoside hydrolase catalytic domain [Bacteroidota bacterium]|nr:family 78 glycoside hydrolase catalytic domain [Bacteroidota bacterium]